LFGSGVERFCGESEKNNKKTGKYFFHDSYGNAMASLWSMDFGSVCPGRARVGMMALGHSKTKRDKD
jgi:hypothetical protein